MADKNPSTAYLFVYGSLRQAVGHSLHQLILQNADFVDSGWLQAKLYPIAGYPGAILSDQPEHQVLGEIYRLTDCQAILVALDEYEECSDRYPEPHEYRRVTTTVYCQSGTPLTAWVYLYNHPLTSTSPIPSGDWLAYLGISPESDKPN